MNSAAPRRSKAGVFLKAPKGTSSETCQLFREQQHPRHLRSTLLSIAGTWNINMRGWLSEEDGLWLTENLTQVLRAKTLVGLIYTLSQKSWAQHKKNFAPIKAQGQEKISRITRSLESLRPRFKGLLVWKYLSPGTAPFGTKNSSTQHKYFLLLILMQ